jgi:hypothetical protein
MKTLEKPCREHGTVLAPLALVACVAWIGSHIQDKRRPKMGITKHTGIAADEKRATRWALVVRKRKLFCSDCGDPLEPDQLVSGMCDACFHEEQTLQADD